MYLIHFIDSNCFFFMIIYSINIIIVYFIVELFYFSFACHDFSFYVVTIATKVKVVV